MVTPLSRSKVQKRQTWNSESVFSSSKQFDAEVKKLIEDLAQIKKFQGNLGDSPDTFLTAKQFH